MAVFVVLAGVAGAGIQYVNQKSSESPATTTPTSVPIGSAQPIRVTNAVEQPIQAWVFAEGTARAVQRQYLTFDRAGRVTFVKRSRDGGELRAGESVSKGEVLARLDARQYESEIDSAQATVAEAKAQLAVAQTDIAQAQTQFELAAAKYRRTKQLLDNRATSKAEYEEVEANMKNAEAAKNASVVKAQALEASVNAAEARLRQARLALEEIEIFSPINGVIAYLNIEEGFYFTQSNIRTTSESEALQTIPMVVIDPSHYEVTVDVPAYQADSIRVDQSVQLVPGGTPATAAFASKSSSSAPDTQSPANPIRGRVFSINPAVNPGGRSVQLKIRTTHGAERLKDGMFVACWIEVQNKPQAVVAPFDAFLFEENQPYVFVIDPTRDAATDAGIARRAEVRIGIESLNSREIINGVRPGELLATDGRYRLVDGAPVRIVNGNAEGKASPVWFAEGPSRQ